MKLLRKNIKSFNIANSLAIILLRMKSILLSLLQDPSYIQRHILVIDTMGKYVSIFLHFTIYKLLA